MLFGQFCLIGSDKPLPKENKENWSRKDITIYILFGLSLIGVLLPKLFWPFVRKNCSSDWEKLLKFEAEGGEFAKKFEITKTIYSNSERSEQVLGFRNMQEKLEQCLVTECCF